MQSRLRIVNKRICKRTFREGATENLKERFAPPRSFKSSGANRVLYDARLDG